MGSPGYRSAVLLGAHVRGRPTLVDALDAGARMGAEVVQVFTQSPRTWEGRVDPKLLARYAEAQAHHRVVRATFCHASYLINLASDDPRVLERSHAVLAANLAAADAMGASGLVLHVGSHRGRGLESCLQQIAEGLLGAFDRAAAKLGRPSECPILVENTAGAGGTIGRNLEELAAVLEAVGGEERLLVCLDTQHLWAAGLRYDEPEAADRLVRRFEDLIGLSRLACLHVNDSKVPFGAGRDRHENIGEGTIGAEALAVFLGHPALQGLPAILEVPGSGSGPDAVQMEALRATHVAGLQRWAELRASGISPNQPPAPSGVEIRQGGRGRPR
jgi:deoxyribonuclease-4